MTETQIISPKISILIPVFNRKDYIAECIQSALDQCFNDFEVIVVDNASNDGTWEICQQFVANDSRVRIFRNETNIGPVRNWKRCVAEAKGEFSKILFSDDCLEPNCLSEMVPKLKDPEVAFVYCAARIGDSRKNSILAYATAGVEKLNFPEYFNHLLRNESPVSPGAILIRTVDLKNNLHCQFPTSMPRPFEKHGAGPDVMISLLTARNYSSVICVPNPLVYFRAHAGSFSIENSNNQVVEGYRSAISFFIKNNYGARYLVKYLAYDWIRKIRADRQWVSPFSYLRENEGNGSLSEVYELFFYSGIYAVNKIFGKKPCLFK